MRKLTFAAFNVAKAMIPPSRNLRADKKLQASACLLDQPLHRRTAKSLIPCGISCAAATSQAETPSCKLLAELPPTNILSTRLCTLPAIRIRYIRAAFRHCLMDFYILIIIGMISIILLKAVGRPQQWPGTWMMVMGPADVLLNSRLPHISDVFVV
jgi:hypothetical protein